MTAEKALQANASGVFWAFQVDTQGRGVLIDEGSIAHAVSEGFQWFHVECDSPNVADWLVNQGLSEHIIDNLTATETRPRTIIDKDGTLIVLRGVNSNPGADPEDMISVRVWFTDKLVITARKHGRRLLSISDMKDRIESKNGPKSSGEFVASLVERIADRIGVVVEAIDEDLARFETDEDLAPAEIRKNLPGSRRQTASIRRYLAPQRDALDTLFRAKTVLHEADALALREQMERTIRYVEDLDLARERTLVLQEELQNRIAQQQNARTYLLSIVATIFLPLSFLTGVFGMNVAGLPGTEDANAFLYVGLGMGILAIASIVYMRFRNWL